MRILFITPHIPKGMKYGGGIRNEAIFNYLCSHYDVYIVIIPWNNANSQAILEIIKKLELDIKGFFLYISKDTFLDNENRSFSKKGIIDFVNPEIIWVYEKWMMRIFGFQRSVPTILDFVDVQWHKHFLMIRQHQGKDKLISVLKTIKSIVEDNILAYRAYRVVVSNVQENKYLLAKSKVVFIPNGHYFPEKYSFRKPLSNRLLFYGTLSYFPNQNGIEWFCREAWPLIKKQAPEATLDIVGDYSSLRDRLDYLKQIPGVNLRGFVDSIDPWIEQSTALVVPLLIGGGTRLKIIEAWAKGLPVVSTTLGCEGLGARHRENVLIADQPEELAKTCLSIMNDHALANELARNGYEHGKKAFDWDNILENIPAIFSKIKSSTIS